MDLNVLFGGLIKIDSESGDEKRFADFCVNYLKKLNFKTGIDSFGNVIAYNYRSHKKLPILLSAHMDTVSPGKGIEPIIVNGRIKSKGNTILGADNKLAIALYFSVIAQMQKKNISLRPIEIVLTRQEELGMLGAKNLDFSMIKSKIGISFDAEGPVYSYVSSSPYAEIFNIEVIGKASHASIPEKGIDALKIFSMAYAKLKTGRVAKDSTVNFGLIKGGNGNNTVIDKVSVEGNLRVHRKSSLSVLERSIDTIFSNVASMYGGRVKSRYTKVIDGYKYSSSDRLVRSLEKSIGHQLIPIVTNSGSDANIYNAHGIKVLEFCHGISSTHTTHESFSFNNAKKLSSIVCKIISMQSD